MESSQTVICLFILTLLFEAVRMRGASSGKGKFSRARDAILAHAGGVLYGTELGSVI